MRHCLKRKTLPRNSLVLAVLVGLWPAMAPVATAQTQVRLPFIDVDAGGGEVDVRLPFIHVYTGPGGTHVRAPFVRVNTGRFTYPYAPLEAAPPRPVPPTVVRVEVAEPVKVLLPEPREPDPRDVRGSPSPVPQLGSPVPQLASPAPDLGEAVELPGSSTPDLGEPAPVAPPADDARSAPATKADGTRDAPATEADGTRSVPATKAEGPAFPPKKRVVPPFPPKDRTARGAKSAAQAERGPVAQASGRDPAESELETAPPAPESFAPSYLVIPLAPGDRRPAVRVTIVELPPPTRPREGIQQTGAVVPSAPPRERKREARREADDLGRKRESDADGTRSVPATARGAGTNVYELVPMWHGEVPAYFEPVEGLHLFAFIHPYTQQTVAVELHLPEGEPRLKISSNEVEFDYGRFEIEVDFKRDGGVRVKYDD